MINIRLHAADPDMLEIYTEEHGKTVIWGVVSIDILFEVDVTTLDIENFDHEIKIL